MTPYVVVLITAPSSAEAGRLARSLVEEKLAACVNVVPGLKSLYRWKGKVESARELLLVAKTRKSRVPALAKRVRALHSYTVPEIVALPLVAGHGDYLRWIDESLK